MSSAEEPIAGDHGMTIYIDGSEFQPLKKIAGRDQLLELAKLDAQDIEIFLIDKDGKRMGKRWQSKTMMVSSCKTA